MKRGKLKSLCGIVLLVSISLTVGAQKKRELSTLVNINYCLPKVAYELEVTMECTTCIPGPYRNFAEKELGLPPEITETSEYWKIEGIEIRPLYLPDEKAMYSISASGEYSSLNLSLSAEGFLAGVMSGDGGVFNQQREVERLVAEDVDNERIDVVKFNTYNYLKEVLDTNYTFQEIDGEMKKIWDPIVRYAPKTESDIMREAVSEIFRIRSERVKLLDADNQVADGKSLEIILKEYDRMEAEYLSLFMGKKVVRQVKRVVTCVPDKADEPVVAFRFSTLNGITDSKNVSVPAYLLKISGVSIPASKPIVGDSEGPALYYRVPAVGELQLYAGKDEIMNFRTIVPQFGVIKKIPLDVINNEGLILEFYPQFGSLKSVRNK